MANSWESAPEVNSPAWASAPEVADGGAFTLDPLRRGVAEGVEGLAKTADALGLPGGNTLHGLVNQNALAAPTASGGLVSDLKNGKYLNAVSKLPAAIEEGIPAALPAIATTIATGGTDIPLVLGAGALTTAATQTGNIAKARAAADGRKDTNWKDAAVGLGASSALGAVGSLGLGEATPGLANFAKQTLIHGAADAAQSAGTQLAETAGTKDGISVDPYDAASQALIGAGTRAGMAGVQRFTPEGRQMAADAQQQALRDQYSSMSPADQQHLQNITQAAKALNDVQQDRVGTGVAPTDQAAARTAARDKESALRGLQSQLQDAGYLDKDETFITDALKEAKNQQGVLTDAHLQKIRDIGLAPDMTDALVNDITQTAMLTDAGVAARSGNIIGKVGSTIGAGLGFSAGAATGGLLHHPFVAADIGRNVGGSIGNRIGAAIGLNQAKLLKDASKAQPLLDAAGVQPQDPPAVTLAKSRSDAQDIIATQQRLMDQQRAANAQMAFDQDSANRMNRTFNADQKAQVRADDAAKTQTLNDAYADNQAFDAVKAAQAKAAAQSPLPDVTAPPDVSAPTSPQPNASPVPPSAPSPTPNAAGTTDGASQHFLDVSQDQEHWRWKVARRVQGELQRAGLPSNIDYHAEVEKTLNDLADNNHLPRSLVDQLRTYNGRVIPKVWRGIENLTLMRHGINRTNGNIIKRD